MSNDKPKEWIDKSHTSPGIDGKVPVEGWAADKPRWREFICIGTFISQAGSKYNIIYPVIEDLLKLELVERAALIAAEAEIVDAREIVKRQDDQITQMKEEAEAEIAKQEEEYRKLEFEHSLTLAKRTEAEREIEHLNRQLADERSGDCDLQKTIRRLQCNFENVQHRLDAEIQWSANGAAERDRLTKENAEQSEIIAVIEDALEHYADTIWPTIAAEALAKLRYWRGK